MTRNLLSLLLVPLAALFMFAAANAESVVVLPPPAIDRPVASAGASETAVLAGGCFWGVQAVFQHVKGVSRAVSGYAGGTKDSATYPLVSSGRTAHAEVVEVTFDPSVVSYGTILQIYFSVAHDPTQLDRQGPDVGPQYRSAIFVADPAQRRVAEAYISQLDKAGVFPKRIVTRIDDLSAFYPAEAYHQDYATLHPSQPYIYIHDRPKVENLKRLFAAQSRATPVLVNASAAK